MNEQVKMEKRRKKHIFLWIFALLTLIIFLIILSYWKTNIVSNALETYINSELANEGTISYDRINGNIVNEFIINDFALELENGDSYSAAKIELKYNIFALMRGDLKLESVIFDSLEAVFAHNNSYDGGEKKNDNSAVFAFVNSIKPADILKNIPDFNLEKLQFIDSRLSYADTSICFSSINLQLHGTKNKNGLALEFSHCSGFWHGKNINFKESSAGIEINDKKISIDNFRLRTDKSSIRLSGNVVNGKESRLFCRVDEANLSFAEWGISSSKDGEKPETVRGAFTISADSLEMEVKGALRGYYYGIAMDSVGVKALINSKNIKFDNLSIKSGIQRIFYKGQYGFDNHINGIFDFAKLNLAALADGGVSSSLDGNLKINTTLNSFDKFVGILELNIEKSEIDALQFDSLHFSARFKNGVYNIVEPSFIRIAENSRFDVSGSIKDTMVSMHLTTSNNDLAVLAGALGADSVAGLFSGKLGLYGKLFDPDLDAQIDMPVFNYKKVHFDSIGFRVKIKRIITKREGQSYFKIDNGNVYDLAIDDITIKAKLRENSYYFPKINFRSGDNYIESELHYIVKEDSNRLIIDKFKGSYQKYWLKNRLPVEIYSTAEEINLKNLYLTGPHNSSLRASGVYEKQSDDLEIYLLLNEISIKPFENFWKKRFDLTGLVNGSVDIINPQKNLEVNLNIKVDSLAYNHTVIGDINSSFVYYNRNFYLNELRLFNGESVLSVEGDLAFSFDSTKQLDALMQSKTNVKINWDKIDIKRYAPLFMKKGNISGNTSGYFEIHGTVKNPMIRNHVVIKDFRYKNIYAEEAQMFAQYNRGYLILDSLGINLNGSAFSVKGWQSYKFNFMQADSSLLNQPFNLFIRSSGDSLDLLKEVNEQVYAVNGKYDLELNVGGTLKSPSIESGHIYLENGEILLSQVLDPVKNVNIKMDIENSLLTFNRFMGNSSMPQGLIGNGWNWLLERLPWNHKERAQGVVSISGNIGLHNIMRPTYDMSVSLNDFYIDNYLNNTNVVLNSTDLSIKGRDTVHISGKVEISDGEYIVDMEQLEKNIYLSSPKMEQSYPLIDEDIKISIPNDFIISSASLDLTNNFKIAINGDLQLIKPAGEENTQISGLIETTSGKYAAWNQTFEINSGEILFDTPNTINPMISIIATKVIKDQKFYLTISGRLDELEQTIRVEKGGRELNLSEGDKLSMLTFGTDLSGLSSNADSTVSNMGGDIATRALLNVVERGAEDLTGLDKISVNSSGSLVDFQKMKLNNGLKDASISFGKFITGDLYLEYRTKFSENFPAPTIGWQAGNRIFLEYRIYKRLKIDSYYEATQAGKMKIQLGVSWEYDF